MKKEVMPESQNRETGFMMLPQVIPSNHVWQGNERGEECMQEEGEPEGQNRPTHLEILYPCGSGLILNLEKGRNRG